MCTNMEKVHKDLSHLKERYAKISESSMKDDIKVDLMKRHLVAIMDLESEVKTCEGE